MKTRNDYALMAESYSAIYSNPTVSEANAAPKQKQQDKQPASRIKDMQGFNSNLSAIDQLEDKMLGFVEVAQKTGWMTGQEISGAQKILQNFLTQTIMSLLVSTGFKDQGQLQQALQAIKGRIKFVDTNHIAGLYQQYASGQPAQQPQNQQQAAATPGQQPQDQQQAGGYGVPSFSRYEQAKQTVLGTGPGGKSWADIIANPASTL